MLLVAGVRWSFRGKDAGSVRIGVIRSRLRTRPRGEQRGLAASEYFVKPSWDRYGARKATSFSVADSAPQMTPPTLAWAHYLTRTRADAKRPRLPARSVA
jgi:hypothetical protein